MVELFDADKQQLVFKALVAQKQVEVESAEYEKALDDARTQFDVADADAARELKEFKAKAEQATKEAVEFAIRAATADVEALNEKVKINF